MTNERGNLLGGILALLSWDIVALQARKQYQTLQEQQCNAVTDTVQELALGHSGKFALECFTKLFEIRLTCHERNFALA